MLSTIRDTRCYQRLVIQYTGNASQLPIQGAANGAKTLDGVAGGSGSQSTGRTARGQSVAFAAYAFKIVFEHVLTPFEQLQPFLKPRRILVLLLVVLDDRTLMRDHLAPPCDETRGFLVPLQPEFSRARQA